MPHLPNHGFFCEALDYASSPFVRDAEMEVATVPTTIDGKVLSTPPMQYRKGSEPLVKHFIRNSMNVVYYITLGPKIWSLECSEPAVFGAQRHYFLGCC